jgi:hypothetical protein
MRNCTNFLFIAEENGDIYEAVRNLIPDPYYHAIEDNHFRKVNSLILDWHSRQCIHVSLFQAKCPPVEVIKDICRKSRLFEERDPCRELFRQFPQV